MLWINFLNVPQSMCPPEDDQQALVPKPADSATAAVPDATGPQSSASETGGLRGLVQDTPPSFRCAIDGQLLVDPVRSPMGHAFERSVLARHLQVSQGVCPITGTHLNLADCRRDT